ncbi:hypothetical protein D9619_001304 [Psilocybe cf. subviscida]|uniref:Uncharacterized protein n=1 Tax=Psilocybe cf. subviscida TaxID=2480587 RepID=A0A8H5F3G9_9AGAR|nr:hypothetical protein D9619_001304 [Psilocybe cf. subviscida]
MSEETLNEHTESTKSTGWEGTLDQRSIVRLTQAVNAWFRRAGSLPINLFLYVDCKVTSRKNLAYNFSLLLKAIGPWTPRVARLGIGGQHWINLMTHFTDMEWELPNLDTLEILGQPSSEGDLINSDIAKLEALAPRIILFRTCGPKFTTLIANQEMTSYFSAFSFLPWQLFTSVILKEQLPSQQQISKFFSVRMSTPPLSVG